MPLTDEVRGRLLEVHEHIIETQKAVVPRTSTFYRAGAAESTLASTARVIKRIVDEDDKARKEAYETAKMLLRGALNPALIAEVRQLSHEQFRGDTDNNDCGG